MKTNIIQWDKSMAARCLARCKNYYTYADILPRRTYSHKAVTVKAPLQSDISVDIPVGEWDGFVYALNSELKKDHHK